MYGEKCNMKIRIYYRKNLKLSPQKLASSCTHIGKELGKVCGDTNLFEDKVIVLMASDKKFKEIKQEVFYTIPESHYHLHIDNGVTEVMKNTEIAFGWIEKE